MYIIIDNIIYARMICCQSRLLIIFGWFHRVRMCQSQRITYIFFPFFPRFFFRSLALRRVYYSVQFSTNSAYSICFSYRIKVIFFVHTPSNYIYAARVRINLFAFSLSVSLAISLCICIYIIIVYRYRSVTRFTHADC